MCAVLFDGPDGGQALPEAGSLMALGVEEIHLLQKVHQIIRANPGKAEGLIEKFRQILKEENKEELICNHCPGSVRTLHKRGVGLRRKVAKKRKVSKEKEAARKKDRQNIKSRKVERKQTGVENSNKPRKLGKKEKQKQKKKNINTKMEEVNCYSCTELWAELINVGLGVATTLRKQVMDIDLVIKN